MERNNFEQHIQKSLKDRTIQPSENAWNRIAADLPTKQTKKSKKYIWWYGIAASIAIIFSLFLFNSENETIQTPDKVAEEEVKTLPEQLQQKTPVLENTSIATENIVTIASKKDNKPVQKKTSVLKKDIQQQNKNTEIASTTANTTVDDKKVNQLIATLQDIQKDGNTITDATIDSLLQKAQREIAMDRAWQKANGEVDAMALLNEVEDELETSFKQRVFEAIEKGYFTIKSAVADNDN